MGTPDGTNSLKKPSPCLPKPMARTIRMVMTPKVAVTAICEVAVKLRNRPRKFIARMKVKMVKTNGNSLRPSWPMMESTRPSIIENRVSPTAWVRPGTILAPAVTSDRNSTTMPKATVMARWELVKARVCCPITGRFTSTAGVRGTILNWCSGSAIEPCVP